MSFQFEAAFFHSLLSQVGARPNRLLVVGCGPGEEMATLAREVGAVAYGVDLTVSASSRGEGVRLVRADARHLPFRDGAFDALYCYHVLEHVPGPRAAVAEGWRVLDSGGPAYCGTPNKSRLVGYIGGRATTGEKFRWNLEDYRRRLLGRWSNELGAHAGFTSRELQRLLAERFPSVRSVSLPYYLGKYPRLSRFWRWMFACGLSRFVAPSVYFLAVRDSR